jgi:tetratricopeptide (TPR) repeat protein
MVDKVKRIIDINASSKSINSNLPIDLARQALKASQKNNVDQRVSQSSGDSESRGSQEAGPSNRKLTYPEVAGKAIELLCQGKPNDRIICDLIHQTAQLLDHNKPDLAFHLWNSALVWLEENFGSKHDMTRRLLISTVEVFCGQKRPECVERIVEGARGRCQNGLDPDTLHELGFAYLRQAKSTQGEELREGLLNQAKQKHLEALDILRRDEKIGPEHLKTAESLNILGTFYLKRAMLMQGELKESQLRDAEQVLQKARDIQKYTIVLANLTGMFADHQTEILDECEKTSDTVYKLGIVYLKRAKLMRGEEHENLLKKAIQEFKQALDIKLPDRYRTADIHQKLGRVYMQLNYNIKAFEHLSYANQLREGNVPSDVFLLAAVEQRMRHYSSAIRRLEETIPKLEETLGLEHPDTIKLLDLLLECYMDQAMSRYPSGYDRSSSYPHPGLQYANLHLSSAAEQCNKTVVKAEQKRGFEDKETIRRLKCGMELFCIHRQPEYARQLCEQAFSRRVEVLWDQHSAVINCLTDGIEVFRDYDKPDHAKKLWENAVAKLEPMLGPEHRVTKDVKALEHQINFPEDAVASSSPEPSSSPGWSTLAAVQEVPAASILQDDCASDKSESPSLQPQGQVPGGHGTATELSSALPEPSAQAVPDAPAASSLQDDRTPGKSEALSLLPQGQVSDDHHTAPKPSTPLEQSAQPVPDALAARKRSWKPWRLWRKTKLLNPGLHPKLADTNTNANTAGIWRQTSLDQHSGQGRG